MDGQGALMIAEISRQTQKWTTVGVPNARMPRWSLFTFDSEISVITTNCRPVKAPAEEPTIT